MQSILNCKTFFLSGLQFIFMICLYFLLFSSFAYILDCVFHRAFFTICLEFLPQGETYEGRSHLKQICEPQKTVHILNFMFIVCARVLYLESITIAFNFFLGTYFYSSFYQSGNYSKRREKDAHGGAGFWKGLF